MYNTILYYFIFGLIWTLFFELLFVSKEGKYLTNIERIVHFLFWPIWIIIFIVSWVIGVIKGFINGQNG